MVQSCRPRKTASTLCPVDFVADRGGCNGDSPRVGGFGTASATPLIERSAAPRPSTATELSPQICSWGLEKTCSRGPNTATERQESAAAGRGEGRSSTLRHDAHLAGLKGVRVLQGRAPQAPLRRFGSKKVGGAKGG